MNLPEKIINELNSLKKILNQAQSLKQKIKSNIELLKEMKDNEDKDILDIIKIESKTICKELNTFEINILLSGKYDDNDAIMEIHAGAGGTEADDWASMLKRMYLRWCEKKNYKVEIVDEQEGTEAGIKSTSIIIKGSYVFGQLKNEKGIHRLIRLSPFDSDKRRHTSFASIEVIPLIDNDINIEINSCDIRIDVYRSSGAGGQGVNTTDSAVRITHLPTNIVVTCQNERSQIQNKARCLEILKSKLYQLEEEKQQNEMGKLKSSHKDINFGSQIRSYIMHPYSLVKDHRTNTEETNVNKVLDGDIDVFIQNNLKKVE